MLANTQHLFQHCCGVGRQFLKWSSPGKLRILQKPGTHLVFFATNAHKDKTHKYHQQTSSDLNSGNSVNESAESLEYSIDCKENHLGLEMPMYSFVSLTALHQKLPLNKSPGPDCISAEHLLCVGESLSFFLSALFNMCIVHGYVPKSCLNTTIVPICKNKNGKMSDTSNYRPMGVVTVVSKLHEHFILSNISPFLGTTDNQFGFMSGHSTD